MLCPGVVEVRRLRIGWRSPPDVTLHGGVCCEEELDVSRVAPVTSPQTFALIRPRKLGGVVTYSWVSVSFHVVWLVLQGSSGPEIGLVGRGTGA